MNAEEELKEYRDIQTRKARITAFILGAAAVISVLFMLYGFAQSIEAERQRMFAEAKEKEALQAQVRVLEAEVTLKEMADSLEVAKKTVEECEKRNKKK